MSVKALGAYEATVDPGRVAICHCADCQKLTEVPPQKMKDRMQERAMRKAMVDELARDASLSTSGVS